MEDCIFCKIINGELPCIKVFEDDGVLAFSDINPVAQGHTLIIPKNHAQDLWEIGDSDLAAVHRASKKVINGIKTALNPAGVVALQLNGRGVNQVVMHYHLHLIPRISGEPELPMSSWELTPGNMEVIKETADKIASAII